MIKKVLLATEKSFAKQAVVGIESIFQTAGYELSKLENYTSKGDLLTAVSEVDALIVRSDIVDKEVLMAAQKLKIVVRAGAGYDNIDDKLAGEKGIVVMNTPGQNSNAVAELVIGMMVYLARGRYNGKSGTELRGKKLGIHAYGNVGRYVGIIAKGFGMEVYAFDPFVPKAQMLSEGIKVFDNVNELYESCDYISLHLPKTKETVKSINYDLLSLMPSTGTLINTARGEVVCEDSIYKILEERKGFKYGTDITPQNDEAMRKFGDRYFSTPKKMGAQTEEANINAGIASAEQIVNFFEKGDVRFKVN